MIIYEYNGSDVWYGRGDFEEVSHIRNELSWLAEKHNCDISEINVRFTE